MPNASGRSRAASGLLTVGLWLSVLAFFSYFAIIVTGDLLPLEHFGAQFELGAEAGYVRAVEANSPASRSGLRAGDRIVAFEGRPIRNTLDWAAVYTRIREDDPIRMTTIRAGIQEDRVVLFQRRPDGPFETAERRLVILLRAAQAVTLLFAVAILIKARGREAILGFWLLATIGIYSVGLPPRMASVWRELPLPVELLLYLPALSKVVIGVILLAFFRALLRRPLIDSTGVALATVALGCVAWDLMFLQSLMYRPSWVPRLTPLLPVVVLFNLGCVVAALVALVRHYRALRNPSDRRRLRWITVGSAVGLSAGAPTISGLWLGLSDPTLIYDTPPSLQVAYTTFFVMPAAFWWAIARRQLFDIRFVVRRGLQYLFARQALLVFTPAALTVMALDAAWHRNESLQTLTTRHGVVYGAVAAGLVALRFRKADWLDAIDRRLFRERYDSAKLLRDLAVKLRSTTGAEDAAQFALSQVSAALHPDWLALYGSNRDEAALHLVAGNGTGIEQSWPRDFDVVREALQRGSSVDVHAEAPIRAALSADEGAQLDRAGVHLILPIRSGGGVDAVMMLGGKRSGEPYGHEDKTLLQAVAASVGTWADSTLVRHDTTGVRAGSDAAWEQRLWTVADTVAAGNAVDWDGVTTEAGDDDRRLVLLELQALQRLMDVHGAPSAVPTEDDTEAGGRRWGSFELRELIGAGRFGTVYSAWDPVLEREVAVKLLDMTDVDHAAYLREARHLARVRHRNVVDVYGADVIGGVPGFWMERLDGETLAQIVRRDGPLSAQDASAVASAMCDALSAVHGAGLLHQDVKAENVMRERDGRLVLMDLGAVTPDSDRPRWGTPRYMAPELQSGAVATIRSDLYSLGVLLFYLSTAELPFESTRDGHLRSQHAAPAGRLCELRPDLSIQFCNAVGRALSPDPDARFDRAEDLWAAIRSEAA